MMKKQTHKKVKYTFNAIGTQLENKGSAFILWKGRMRAEDLRFVVKNDKINWKRDRKIVAKIA